MLPDSTPQDLFQNKTKTQQPGKAPISQPSMGKPLKPMLVGPNLANKPFTSSSSCYNSSKNLKNQMAHTNNRYSSQNMKSFEYDDDNEEQEEDEAGDIADENCCQTEGNIQVQKRESQRYKDRIRSLRVQSQETYQRDGGTNYTYDEVEEGDDDFEIFERARDAAHTQLQTQQYALTESARGQAEPDLIYKQYRQKAQNQQKWTTQPFDNKQQVDTDQMNKTPLDSNRCFDNDNAPQFQYKELLKRLSDITSTSKDKDSSVKTKNQVRNSQNADQEGREPLREKTMEFINQQIILSTQKNKPNSGSRGFSSSAKNSKRQQDTKKNQQQLQHNNLPNNQITHSKLTKLLLTNQENNFIDKKMKDQTNNKKKTTRKAEPSFNQNKSHQNLHKSVEKTLNKASQSSCSINNMKLKQSQANTHTTNTNKASMISNLTNSNSKPQAHKNGNPNNIFTNTIVTANNSSNNGFNAKCPSSNFLRTATTALTNSTTKSSTLLTQCSSNKQINHAKETPETTSRQKVKLSATALSSTSKRGNPGAFTTVSTNSQGNTIQASSIYQSNGGTQYDSNTKKSQNSDSKQNKANGNSQQPSSIPRSNSNNSKIEFKKMMIKNTSFLKTGAGQSQGGSKQANDFYQTIYKKIQNTNFTPNGIAQSNKPSVTQCQIKMSAGNSAKGSKTSGKVSQRLSEHGINKPAFVQSNSPSRTRKSFQNEVRESGGADQLKQVQGAPLTFMNTTNNQINLSKVNYILKKLQDNGQSIMLPQKQALPQQQQPQQQSILLSQQLKKPQIKSGAQRPVSGKAVSKQIHNQILSNRKNSIETSGKQDFEAKYRQATPQMQLQLSQMEQSFESKQQQENNKTSEKRGKVGIHAQASLKTQGNRYITKKQEELELGIQKGGNNNKKGFLLQNLMMQKTNKQQKAHLEAYERLHQPTEVENRKDFDMMSLLQYANFATEENCEDQDLFSQLKNEGAPPLSGHRLSQGVKIKAKNF